MDSMCKETILRRNSFGFFSIIVIIFLSLFFFISTVTVCAAGSTISAPSNIKLTSTEDSVTITWNKVSGAHAYRVYRAIDPDDEWKKWKDVAGTSVTVDNLKSGKTYYFRLASINDGQVGTKSGTKSIKTKSDDLPKAPKSGYTGLAKYEGNQYYFKNGKICKGFIKTDNGYMYFDRDTYTMVKGWKTVNNNKYFFGKDGIMLSGGAYKIGSETYTFGNDGKLVATAITSYAKPETKTAEQSKRTTPGEFQHILLGDSLDSVVRNSGIANYTVKKIQNKYDSYACIGEVLFSGIESNIIVYFNKNKQCSGYMLLVPTSYSEYSKAFVDSCKKVWGLDYSYSDGEYTWLYYSDGFMLTLKYNYAQNCTIESIYYLNYNDDKV